jgi:amidase
MKNILVAVFVLSVFITSAQTKRIDFKPTLYYRHFSHKNPPVIKVAQGDTLLSESVDAGGFDKTGTHIAERGNPLTGPFYIEGAAPGDIVAITMTKVSLNRDYASTIETFNQRCLPKKVIEPVYGRNGKLIKWTLDRKNGYAAPQQVHEHLENFMIPLHPFMGCVGVAAPLKNKEPLTYFADQYGGNMDFDKVTVGATIYLPVFHDGALVYIGDGHAAQGDGEINGDALETSMDFAFVAHVIKGAKIMFPKIEDSEYIIALGMENTLEDALKTATLNLLEWVQKDFGLSLKEATQVIGPSIEYRIPTLSGPKLEVAAMIKKEILKGLAK